MTDAGSPMTGVVTFLFTDIEGSTRLELALGTERYAAVRERHRELLRAAFASNGGTEQSTQGDSFFVLFEGARAAIHAAIEGQRALAREPWPDGIEVLVRMGLHAGEAMVTVGDVVGYDVNRAARIAAAGHGGQIVISDTVRALAGGGSDGAFELRDLGEHRLKDLLAPERLAQVVAADLQAEFPPLHSLDARPNNLPTQLTSFVGRRDELEEALRLLRESRLLTLTGPGGIGKTRLSLQVAAAAADEFPDGVWFVPLEPVRERDLVAPTIARMIGVIDKASRSVIDGIAEAIGDGRVLFVLDNFEQVVEAAPVLTEMLARSPGLRILVSSRTALRVYGEQEFAVPGLPAPPDPARLPELERLNLPVELRSVTAATLEGFESAQLFAARARSVRPGFELTDANAPAVGRITARLHGMPLAIELAAARVKLLSPEQIVARLEDHLALLSSGSRDLPERQQTLRGAIAWSYDLLEPGTRRLLNRLAVFVGGCELDVADRVCGPASEVGIDVLDGVATLVDQSLLRVEEGPDEQRYVMFDAIREYAAEMLTTSGECDDIEERRSRAYLDLAEEAAPQLASADQRRWLDRLEREHDNLRATLMWAANRPDPELAVRVAFALWRFWQQRGYLNEARARLDDLRGRDWDLAPVLQARLAEARGGVAYWQADQVTAEACYRKPSSCGGRSAIDARSPTRCSTGPMPMRRGSWAGSPAAMPRRRGRCSRRRSRSIVTSVTPPARATSSGRSAASSSSPTTWPRPRRPTARRWRCTGPGRTGRWRPGRCTCWRCPWCRRSAPKKPRRLPARRSCTSRRPATSRASRSSSTICRGSRSSTRTWSGRAGSGVRLDISRRSPARTSHRSTRPASDRSATRRRARCCLLTTSSATRPKVPQ